MKVRVNKMEKEINKRVRDYLSNDKQTIEKAIGFLIEEKQRLNERIDEIIYDDFNRDLTKNEIDKINEYRKGVAYCYNTIEDLEKRKLKNESK